MAYDGATTAMSDFQIELRPEFFQRAYLLYVIEVKNDGRSHFYIGQTGDPHYVSARPAFYRLAGHLEPLRLSTQNQVFKAIASVILGLAPNGDLAALWQDTRQQVNEFLAQPNTTVVMHSYVTAQFDAANHQRLRRNVQRLEEAVVYAFRSAGRRVLNLTPGHNHAQVPYPQLLQRIKTEFQLHPQ